MFRATLMGFSQPHRLCSAALDLGIVRGPSWGYNLLLALFPLVVVGPQSP